MGGYENLGFLGILRESMKAISKNGKLIATITSITILLEYSLLLLTRSFSTKAAIDSLVTQVTLLSLSTPNTTNVVESLQIIKKDVQIIVGFELLYLLPALAISLFSIVIMTLGSAIAYSDKNLSSQDFLLRIPKIFLRTLVTSFHVQLHGAGYVGLFLALFFSVMILTMGHLVILILIAITLCSFALIFLMYLAVFWKIALVISVIEKSCYGLEALGKAGGIIKGKRLQYGFALNLFYTILTVIICMSFRGNPDQKRRSTQIICQIFGTVFNCMVTMVYFMSYTVLYFQCKKTHGEEIEFQGSFEFSKIPSK